MTALPGWLLWRCRRGVRELDVMLEAYLRGRYLLAPDVEQAAFLALLDLPNDRLMDYLLGLSSPDEGPARQIVEYIRRQPPA